jgi:hypothetical protein
MVCWVERARTWEDDNCFLTDRVAVASGRRETLLEDDLRYPRRVYVACHLAIAARCIQGVSGRHRGCRVETKRPVAKLDRAGFESVEQCPAKPTTLIADIHAHPSYLANYVGHVAKRSHRHNLLFHCTDQELAAIREVRCVYAAQIIVPRTVTGACLDLSKPLDVQAPYAGGVGVFVSTKPQHIDIVATTRHIGQAERSSMLSSRPVSANPNAIDARPASVA